MITKANAIAEGRPDFMNHLKAAVDSLSALAWIAFTGKGCGKLCINFCTEFFLLVSYLSSGFQGMNMPTAHVEGSWEMAEFYNNKVFFMHA